MPDYTAADLQDVFVYAMIDEYLKESKHLCQKRASAIGLPVKLTDAEIIFVFITPCLEYGGNCGKALRSLKRHGLIKQVLDKSQFNRRLHALSSVIFEILCMFSALAKADNKSFAIDSFPVPVCKNIHIRSCRLLKGKAYHGYSASKREYFYGYKVHLITAADGRILEFEFSPGACDDRQAFGLLGFDLSAGSEVFADKIYNCYQAEESLKEEAQIHFQPIRKQNSRKQDNPYLFNRLKQQQRRHIETDISMLENLFPRKIHAVTANGFLLKLLGLMIAHHCCFYLY
jgi:hypothetical protein